MALTPNSVDVLKAVSTATITTVLLKEGLLTFVNWGEPVGCGGVAVIPDDVIVADRDGAVVIPQALVDHVLTEGPEQERMEAWIVDEVNRGAALPGLYPMNSETKARYTASRKKS
jgi:regulator of RNase E activity RraA